MLQQQFPIDSVVRRSFLHRFMTARQRCGFFDRMLMNTVLMQTTLERSGLSAGGHLTALLATSGGVAELEGNGGNRRSVALFRRLFLWVHRRIFFQNALARSRPQNQKA
jgi:hypothetical protein